LVEERLSKKKLEILLDNLKGKTIGHPTLEQHRTPGWIASDIVWIARQLHIIENRKVLDLGSGVGILCIAAVLAGASRCISVEIDPESISLQIENIKSSETETRIDVIRGDARVPPLRRGCCDLAIMNPPFGTVRKGTDLEFLKSALSLCPTSLSLHLKNEKSREFISREMKKIGKEAKVLKTYKMELKQIFEYHKSKIRRIDVDLYVVV
jgi:putative methylase